MKKIINGKKYDTETANELGEGWNEFNPGDFHYYKESLFQKKTGEFFLSGEGGPLSKYAEKVGLHGSSSGSGIIPISEEEARNWCEEHLSTDEYEEIFGEVEE